MKSRRFYKTVSVTGDLGIALDGRLVKTPGKVPLHLPLPALAQAVAAEWEAQGETIDPASMVMTRLANTAIDRVPAHRPAILAEMPTDVRAARLRVLYACYILPSAIAARLGLHALAYRLYARMMRALMREYARAA